MKRVLTVFLMMALMGVMTACGNDNAGRRDSGSRACTCFGRYDSEPS